jgi:hypothetical protein
LQLARELGAKGPRTRGKTGKIAKHRHARRFDRAALGACHGPGDEERVQQRRAKRAEQSMSRLGERLRAIDASRSEAERAQCAYRAL